MLDKPTSANRTHSSLSSKLKKDSHPFIPFTAPKMLVTITITITVAITVTITITITITITMVCFGRWCEVWSPDVCHLLTSAEGGPKP